MVGRTNIYEADVKIGQSESYDIIWRRFTEFFCLYRALYWLTIRYIDQNNVVIRNEYDVAEDLKLHELSRFNWQNLIDIGVAYSLECEKDLYIVSICRENPVHLHLKGIGYGLAVAAIISGGEVHIGPDRISVDLKPLGNGIEEIVEAIEKYHDVGPNSDPTP